MWEDDLYRSAASLDLQAAAIEEAGKAVAKACGLPEVGQSLQDYASMDVLAEVLLGAPAIPVGLAARASDPTVRTRVRDLREHGTRRNEIWTNFASSYAPGAATLNGVELGAGWDLAKAAWWPKRWFAKRAVAARLAAFRGDKRRPAAAEVETLLPKLSELNVEDSALQSMKADAQTLLDSTYTGTDTDWAAVERHEVWTKAFTDVTTRFGGKDVAVVQAVRARILPFGR